MFVIFYEWASEGRHFSIIGSGDNRYQLLDVEDLCQAIFSCMTLVKDQVNDTFNIGAAGFTTKKLSKSSVSPHSIPTRKLCCVITAGTFKTKPA